MEGFLASIIGAGGTLENAQAMAAHESPRTTKLYDRAAQPNAWSFRQRRPRM